MFITSNIRHSTRKKTEEAFEELRLKFEALESAIDKKAAHKIVYAAPMITPPKPLDVRNGDLRENFNFFKFQWVQYGLSTGLNVQTEEIKVATLLTFLGEDCA